MFTKILIANRGEIAARVIATARRMGVASVAVHSQADMQARHVDLADEAVGIGPAPVADSYLVGRRLIEAALATGAQAIHPGYGFLSENPDFVEAVEAAGLTFVGPPADAIRAMGLKDAAKALMEQAGVPVVPGYHGSAQDLDTLSAEADRIGYPVLIKARAGGGGKGMRLVERAEDFADALAAAQREGQASFGDPACLVEKYITKPRHVEIQIFADAHGNVVHLFERDCSLQRRHQKVIEEAPAPDMPPEVRAAMGAAAVEAARAIGYQGAGTVEFIADGSGPLRADGFWFMEMNTRLQVEHPVTEAITGLDLVELQLRAAAGEPLGFDQSDLSITGHSFEARLYAEDAAKGFLPATGHLDHLAFPEGAEFAHGDIRIDSGVRSGDDISPYYDPMIAKIIVHGPDRATALARLGHALDRCEVAGLVTNLGFLARLARHPGFAAGDVDTGLIERDSDDLTATPDPSFEVRALATVVASGMIDPPRGNDPWTHLRGWRAWGMGSTPVDLIHAGDTLQMQIAPCDEGFVMDGTMFRLRRTEHGVILSVNCQSETLRYHRKGDTITIFDDAESHVFTIPDPLLGEAGADQAGDAILSPMPGLVTLLRAAAGERVEKGQPLVTLEAMKMEHTLSAPRDGVIAEVLAAQGDQVQDGMVLIRLEDPDD
ncbi:MAG: acetyl/propionyl/methylcrotonyl-CoA carboxylase subunit alpha [Marinibacterium sp.]|nr:acetyl/propionyl/methylcrotonyl-CoA carboxylase subunit alpha [Marinibacterium sp.]